MFRFTRQSFLPVPVSAWEAVLLRLFFAVLTVWCMWKALPYGEVEVPNGLARVLPASWFTVFGGEGAVWWFRPLIVVAALLYVVELANPLGLVLLTVAHLGYNTLQNSQGFTYHGYNIIGLALLAQCAAELWWARSRFMAGVSKVSGAVRRSYQLYFAQCAIAAVYVTSAITKLSKSDGMWLFQSHYLAKSIVKTHRQTFYDNPEGLVVPPIPTVAQWLAEHHVITRLLFGAGFFLELLAFVALWNRAWALVVGVSIIAFHFGVELMMQLDFRVNQMMCLIFLVNVPYWIWWLLEGRHLSGTMQMSSLTRITKA